MIGEAVPENSAYLDTLMERCHRRGIQDRVRWTGFLPSLERVLSAADVLVVCNDEEGLPRCMLEALPYGIPLLGPCAGGVAEIVVDGENGLLFEPNSVKSLTARLLRLLTDTALRQRLGIGARDTMYRFDIRDHVEQVIRLYENLVGSGSEQVPE